MSNHLLCFGMGFSARALAALLQAEGDWRVSGTTRSRDKAEALKAEGIAPVILDINAPTSPIELDPPPSHILVSIPPDALGDAVARHFGAWLTQEVKPHWVGYLSTTGVYGDHGGAWVDEETAIAPDTERGERRALAEQDWLDLAHQGLPVHVFRLAGIYGPGRNALEMVKTGRARRIIKPGQVFSRIHVDDIAAALAASIAHPRSGGVYNVCDDEPAPPADPIEFAADLLGVDPPPAIPFDQADMSPMARSFYADSKRVSNRRIKQELRVELTYPSYREGLRALYDAMD